MISHQMKYRLLYADTDAMGIMYYANYFRIYEAARSEFMRSIGFSLSEAATKGIVCPAIKVNAEYIRVAKFDEEVTIITTIEGIPQAKIVFHQSMYDKDKNVLNRAIITLGFVNTENFKAVRCPEWLKDCFTNAIKRD